MLDQINLYLTVLIKNITLNKMTCKPIKSYCVLLNPPTPSSSNTCDADYMTSNFIVQNSAVSNHPPLPIQGLWAHNVSIRCGTRSALEINKDHISESLTIKGKAMDLNSLTPNIFTFRNVPPRHPNNMMNFIQIFPLSRSMSTPAISCNAFSKLMKQMLKNNFKSLITHGVLNKAEQVY